MADDTISNKRRRFLQAMGVTPAAALLGGMALSAEKAQAQEAQTGSTYTPTYFNAEEWAFINAAVARLIPSNEDGPGGIDLNVPEFIDQQMESSYGHGDFWYMDGPYHPEADYTLGYQLQYTPGAVIGLGWTGSILSLQLAQAGLQPPTSRGKTVSSVAQLV